MSVELLALLSRESAFDPTPLPADLAALHVPFDALTGSHATEGALREAAHASGREGTVGILNTRIDVPRLSGSGQLARILDHRVALHAAHRSGSDIFEAPALQRLWEFYETDTDFSLRKTLQIAHTALSEACRAGHELIGPELVGAALAAWPPPARE